ncbi:hypothetical protein LQU92_08605 [Kocuria sp. LUK]|uniref:Uncharacterized protein n=1 Tax=Kocuria flava TaxID=446860 RepID=A0A2N4T0P6_9MICC|nr:MULTISPECIES: hypothetical protein [Kocuria]MCD1145293.1 hypothetical protein [Kocuria sp. LUK]PLC11803.1 hypothetical protein AUQ48_05580 [Kocuria flava]
MNRHLRRTGLLAGLVLCLLALPACGTAAPQRSIVLEETPSARPGPARTALPAADPRTCFDVAGAHTALAVVPLSTDEADPRYRPEEISASVHELASRVPAELRPAFDDAGAVLAGAGDSLQPAELAELQRTLAPVGEWLQARCEESAPTR